MLEESDAAQIVILCVDEKAPVLIYAITHHSRSCTSSREKNIDYVRGRRQSKTSKNSETIGFETIEFANRIHRIWKYKMFTSLSNLMGKGNNDFLSPGLEEN